MQLVFVYDDVLNRVNFSITNRYFLGTDERLLYMDDDFTQRKISRLNIDRLENFIITINNRIVSVLSSKHTTKEQKLDRVEFIVDELSSYLTDAFEITKQFYIVA